MKITKRTLKRIIKEEWDAVALEQSLLSEAEHLALLDEVDAEFSEETPYQVVPGTGEEATSGIVEPLMTLDDLEGDDPEAEDDSTAARVQKQMRKLKVFSAGDPHGPPLYTLQEMIKEEYNEVLKEQYVDSPPVYKLEDGMQDVLKAWEKITSGQYHGQTCGRAHGHYKACRILRRKAHAVQTDVSQSPEVRNDARILARDLVAHYKDIQDFLASKGCR